MEIIFKRNENYLKTMLTSYSYDGRSIVAKIQELMQIIAKSTDEINPKVQSIAKIL